MNGIPIKGKTYVFKRRISPLPYGWPDVPSVLVEAVSSEIHEDLNEWYSMYKIIDPRFCSPDGWLRAYVYNKDISNVPCMLLVEE